MHPAEFADDETLVCTLAAAIYRQLQRSQDPSRTKAMNEFGLVLPWEQRSAAVRNVWEAACLAALESMGIIGDEVRDLRIYTKPAALELEDNESVL
jgi:hypothetical protein